MNPESISDSISDDDQTLLGEVFEPASTGNGSSFHEIEKLLFGDLADPAVRRAREAGTSEAQQALEVEASRVRLALAPGATEASLYAVGRLPEIGGEVIFQNAPATVLKVHRAGEAMTTLDLVQYRQGNPQAFAAVEHDRTLGWSWLGEPPPPDPTPADRIREARAAGVRFPGVGSTVVLMRAAPRSLRGVVQYPLLAQVLAIVDAKLGLPNPAFGHDGGVAILGIPRAEPRFPSTIWLNLEIEREQPVEIDREWPPEQRAADLADFQPCNVAGPLGPYDRKEGWGFPPRSTLVLPPDQHNLGNSDRPCDRCGSLIRPIDEAIKLYASGGRNRLNEGTIRDCFAKLCKSCADFVGHLVFESGPEPLVVRSPEP